MLRPEYNTRRGAYIYIIYVDETLIGWRVSKGKPMEMGTGEKKNKIETIDPRPETWDLRPETWDLRPETWDLRPPFGSPVGPPKINLQKVKKSYFRHSETFAPSKLNIFYQGIRFSSSRGPEGAKMTNLSPLASQKLKLVPILFFLHVEAVQLYLSPSWTQKSKTFWGSAGDAKRLQ